MAMKWFIVHAYSNFEKKVADAIREQITVKGLESSFEDVLVPTEDVLEMRRGRKVNTARKLFPGYVLVRVETIETEKDKNGKMSDEVYHLIKSIPKVTGFLGAENTPVPIPQSEVDRILNQVQEGVERPKPAIVFEIGEQVRVSEGPFASFNGHVEEVDEEKARLKVAVSIFGRETPVELEYGQVEKI